MKEERLSSYKDNFYTGMTRPAKLIGGFPSDQSLLSNQSVQIAPPRRSLYGNLPAIIEINTMFAPFSSYTTCLECCNVIFLFYMSKNCGIMA